MFCGNWLKAVFLCGTENNETIEQTKHIVSFRHSFMKYFWNRGEHSYFNNQYYKAMADPTDYAMMCMKEAKDGFSLTGMPDGTAGKVTFKAHGRGWFKSGGPFTWQKNLDLCFDGGLGGGSGTNKMLEVFATEAEVNQNCFNPSNQLVDGGPGWICNSTCFTPDDFVDEAMLNSDLGLFFEFNVDPKTGRQLGYNEDGTVLCPGLVDQIEESEAWFSETRVHATTANCGKAATADLVEVYARDQVGLKLVLRLILVLFTSHRHYGWLTLRQCLTRCSSTATRWTTWTPRSTAAAPESPHLCMRGDMFPWSSVILKPCARQSKSLCFRCSAKINF